MKILTKVLIILGVVAIAGAGPALAGSKGPRSNGSASVAPPSEPAVSSDAAARTFPARLRGPAQGRADQMARTIVFRRGRTLVTQFHLCVMPSGAVTGIELMKSSGVRAFDTAVLEGANTWVYASYPAPAGTRVCRAISIVYRSQ